jgi:molybdopterin-guanine dinucleotide biosynthesis protein A
MTGIILSGGRGARMGGENKAFLRIGGERLIDRTVRIFRSVFNEVIIVASRPLEYLDQEAAIVTDILPGKGALGGIYTGLFYAGEEHAFVAACDMPFLNRSFLEYMAARAVDYDIVVPAPPDGLQPLHAVYARRCLPAIRGLLERNRLQVRGFYPGHKLLTVPPETLRSFDPEGRMFLNANTPEDVLNLLADSETGSAQKLDIPGGM